MKKERNFFERLFGLNLEAEISFPREDKIELAAEVKTKPVLPPGVPTSQRSSSSSAEYSAYGFSNKRTIQMDFAREVIPVIRKLTWINADVSQALDNVVTLGNTGYELQFDEDMKPEEVKKARAHLELKMEKWSVLLGGRSGIVNRMFRQAMISGAISNEWVPQSDLKGIKKIAFVKAEEIFFKFDSLKQEFNPYQKVKSLLGNKTSEVDGLIYLDLKTFRYLSLQGDDDNPYGIPPYMSALQDLDLQDKMKSNINFIVTQLGIVGFMQMLLEKPDRTRVENDSEYEVRLQNLLIEAKARISGGIRDGIMVGFKDDVEFEFNTATKSVTGVNEIFQEMELQIASGLKMDASLLGRSYSGSEGQITVVLNKQISQLKNIQNLVSENLKFGFTLELLMAGFSFKEIKVVFNPSTLLDDYKLQQGQEVKLRNIQAEYNMGIIGQDKAAERAGYKKADQKKPRLMADSASAAAGKKVREDSKNSSDRKSRKSKKPIDKSQKAKGTRNN